MIGSLIFWFFILFFWVTPSVFCIYTLIVGHFAEKRVGESNLIEMFACCIFAAVPLLSFIIALSHFQENDQMHKTLGSHNSILNSVYKCETCSMYFRAYQSKEIYYFSLYYKPELFKKESVMHLCCPHCGSKSHKKRVIEMENKNIEIPYSKRIGLFESTLELVLNKKTKESRKIQQMQDKKEELKIHRLQLDVKDQQMAAWTALREKETQKMHEEYLRMKKELEENGIENKRGDIL